jgi:hypothetical protein
MIDQQQHDLMQEVLRLRAENAALAANKASKGTGLKVSEKGALSLYGVGRYPVTLYKEQWVKVLEKADEIRAFIVANDSVLKTKEK